MQIELNRDELALVYALLNERARESSIGWRKAQKAIRLANRVKDALLGDLAKAP
jgi:hypothetical protein